MYINYIAPINKFSYGLCGLNIAQQLHFKNVKIAWKPIGGCEASQEYEKLIQEIYSNDFDLNAPSIRLFHEFDCVEHIGYGRHLSWPIFEITNFTGQRKRNLKASSEIVVCSKWGRDVLKDNGFTQPIHIIPLGINADVFRPMAGLKEKNVLTFIHIGKREYRKSQLELLQCFEKAFNPNDNVKLIMVWGSDLLRQRNPAEYTQWTNLYNRSRMTGKIKLIEWVNSQTEVATLLNKADCGLFLSKSEGFNLGCLESLACGLQNITLNYSGQTEFSNSKNSLLVEPTEFEDIQDGVWFTEPDLGTWAYFGNDQKEQTISYMRDLYKRKMAGENLYNKEGVETAAQFTWEATANKLISLLQE